MACFTKLYSKVCAACPNPITPGTTHLLFQEKNYHVECFLCGDCGTKVGSDFKEFYLDEQKKKYCEPCVKTFLNNNKNSSSPSKWTAIIYMSLDAMPSCFECKRQFMNNESFYKGQNDKPYCVECYTKLNSKKCTGCSKMITPSETTISINDQNYHAECLKCFKCAKVLGSGDEIYSKDGQFACEKCV